MRYPAILIETTDIVQEIQLFKLESSIFQVNMELCIKYSRMTKQTLHYFSPTAEIFKQ